MPRYLITSSKKDDGGVFIADSRTRHTKRILSGPFRGMTRGPGDWYYFVSGYRNPEEGESQIVRLNVKTWAVETVGSYPLADCHDLHWFNGHFYLVASRGNQVVRLDAEGRVVDRLQIVEDDRDICHANCLTEINGELYCTIFTLSPGERQEKRLTGAWHREGKLLKLDWERKTYEIVHEPLAQPHSLVRRDDGLFVVESHTSSLTRIDLRTRESRRLAQFYGFLRGMAFGPDELVIGVCVMYVRDRKRLKPLPYLRGLFDRYFPFSGLMVLDTRRWKVRRRIPLPGAEVYDVRLLADGELT